MATRAQRDFERSLSKQKDLSICSGSIIEVMAYICDSLSEGTIDIYTGKYIPKEVV